jgi:hypothetical protein
VSGLEGGSVIITLVAFEDDFAERWFLGTPTSMVRIRSSSSDRIFLRCACMARFEDTHILTCSGSKSALLIGKRDRLPQYLHHDLLLWWLSRPWHHYISLYGYFSCYLWLNSSCAAWCSDVWHYLHTRCSTYRNDFDRDNVGLAIRSLVVEFPEGMENN